MLHPTPRVSARRELTSSAAPGARPSCERGLMLFRFGEGPEADKCRPPLSVGESEGHCFAPGRCGTRRVSMHSRAMRRVPRAPKLCSMTDLLQLGAFGTSRLE